MPEMESKNPSAQNEKWTEKFKLIAAVIGIASPILAFATFLGLKPEKRKALEWEYLSKSSLVNPSAAAVEKIEVSYEQRKIKQLTVISARLVNVGAIPIDGNDVKDGAFPTVTFTNGVNVIGAEIKDRTPSNLKAAITFGTNYVRLEHGLLNPTDSVLLQLVLEGDPGELTSLPPVAYRISGITTPTTRSHLINS
jgi:hypothetical protein